MSEHRKNTQNPRYGLRRLDGRGAQHGSHGQHGQRDSRTTRHASRYAPSSEAASARPHKQNIIARLVNDWFDRVVGAMKDGGLSKAEAQYAPHKTTRDFVWNSAGSAAWACVFPVITMVSTQLVGVEQAGMISMAFVVALLLMFVGNFGVRTYQISDLEFEHSFKDYQANRWVTCALMLVVGWLYCNIRGYSGEMFNITMAVMLYKLVDALADVYEGRLQQVDKLYLAGVSQALRSVLALLVFIVVLFVTHSAVAACYGMAIAAVATFVVVTWPLTLMEAPPSNPFSMQSFLKLFEVCAPLFMAVFLFNLIENMPKFIMEDSLPYDYQLYYNAIYFPAQMILIFAQLVYKPLLLRMAGVWQESKGRGKFNVILFGMIGIIAAITAVFMLVMAWVGIDVLSLMYGIDFQQFRGLVFLMLITGGLVSAIDFLYQVITIMRRQKDVTVLYLITFGFSLFIPLLLVHYAQLEGAVLSYVIIECILFVLLVWEYFRIRASLHGKDVVDGKLVDAVSRAAADAHASASSVIANVGAGGAGVSRIVAAGSSRASGRGRTSFVDLLEMDDCDDAEEDALYESEEPAPKLRPSEIRAERERREEIIRRRTGHHR